MSIQCSGHLPTFCICISLPAVFFQETALFIDNRLEMLGNYYPPPITEACGYRYTNSLDLQVICKHFLGIPCRINLQSPCVIADLIILIASLIWLSCFPAIHLWTFHIDLLYSNPCLGLLWGGIHMKTNISGEITAFKLYYFIY